MLRCRASLCAVLLLALTTTTVAADDGQPGAPPQKPEKQKVPTEGAARAEWIQDLLTKVREEEDGTRRAALQMLVRNDKDGDTTQPLLQLLAENSLAVDTQVDLIRALGIEALVAAVDPLAALLVHEDARIRGNAAISLEYIGTYTAVEPLKKQLAREKLGSVRNHLCRALGRCGALQKPVRAVLLKQLRKMKTDQDLVGPLIGLAYFEGDALVARKIEKLLATSLVPKGMNLLAGRRRAKLMGWALAQIADSKTPRFIRAKVLPRLKTSTSVSLVGIGGSEQEFYEAVARKIDGDPSAAAKVDTAIGGTGTLDRTSGDTRTSTSMAGGGISTMDEMRKGRDMTHFQPKGDRRTTSLRDLAKRSTAR